MHAVPLLSVAALLWCAAAARGAPTTDSPSGADPQPAARLTGVVIDAVTSQPLPARIYIEGADGTWYFPTSAAPGGSAVAYRKQRGERPQSVEMHTTLSPHPFTVPLPPGRYTITVERGHEYLPESREVTVGPQGADVTIPLRRWIDMAQRGWYSGETHVHRSLEELPNVMLAEDLNVAFSLLYWVTEAFTPPRQSARSTQADPGAEPIVVDATHVIYPRNTEYEIFTVGPKRHTLGAFFAIGHRSVFQQGVPPVVPVARQAHAEGALIDLDKSNWPWSMMLVPVMQVDLYELANNHVWRTHFGFPAFGAPPPQYMRVQRDERGFTEWGWLDFNFQNYYALLNCGFRLRPTAGTASGVHPVPLGFGRAYVELDEPLTWDGWLRGLNAGRSFITTGPMLLVRVDDRPAGETIRQDDDARRSYRIAGTAHSARPLERIEIVVSGRVIQTLRPANRATEAGGFASPIEASLAVEETCWVAVRCFADRPDRRIRFAHTAPVHIEVPGKPLRPCRAEIEFLIQRVADELQRNADVLPPAALDEFRQALKVYQEIAQHAR